jgi:hypothetical protein
VDGQRRDRLRRLVADCVDEPGQSGWGQAVCLVCVRAVDQVDAAALTLRTESRGQEMIGASDPWSSGLEETQYTLGEGPGVDAFRSGAPVLVAHLAAERGRWPVFAESALVDGVAAVFAFPLRVGGIRLGTLDLYSRRTGALTSTDQADAAVLADLASLALVERSQRAGHEDGEVRSAVTYQDVNIATGMLAAQLHVGLDEAFARLRAHAYSSGRSVLDVAQDVLARTLPLDHLTD